MTAALVAVTVALVGPGAAQANTCRGGDPPIQVSARTSCSFAGSAVSYVYSSRGSFTRHAWVSSPHAGRWYWLTFRVRWYSRYAATITATGPNGIWMRFDYDAE